LAHYDAGFIILVVGTNQETDNEWRCKHQMRCSDLWGADSRSASTDIFIFTEPESIFTKVLFWDTFFQSQHSYPV